jgi:hypothetical protein
VIRTRDADDILSDLERDLHEDVHDAAVLRRLEAELDELHTAVRKPRRRIWVLLVGALAVAILGFAVGYIVGDEIATDRLAAEEVFSPEAMRDYVVPSEPTVVPLPDARTIGPGAFTASFRVPTYMTQPALDDGRPISFVESGFEGPSSYTAAVRVPLYGATA